MNELVHALKGALDYTRIYRHKTFVIKIGGGILDSEDVRSNIAKQIALLESLSIRLVIVHGGGPQASRISERLGLDVEIVNGRRVTSGDVLEVAKMVFAGQLNVDVLAALRREHLRPVGLSGIDAQLVTARRRPPVDVNLPSGDTQLVDYGHVGDIVDVDASVLNSLLDNGYVPVISTLAADENAQPLNVNADTLAVAIAKSMQAAKLLVLTSAPGLLRDPDDPASLVTFADPGDLEQLTEAGAIRGGMRPKVEACVAAVHGGVPRTHILDGRNSDSLLIELFTGAGCGTMIVGRREKESYRAGEAVPRNPTAAAP